MLYNHIFSDGDEELWPTDLNESGRSRNIPGSSKTLPADTGNLRRSLSSKKVDSALYNMAAIIAGVGAGYDIRLSNKTGIHPDVEGATETKSPSKRDSFILNRRDAYNAAVRDLFLEPELDYKSYYSAASGGIHNTYHGHQTKYRPSVQDIPIRFPDRSVLDNSNDDDDEDDENMSTLKSTSTLVPRVSPTHRLSVGESDDGTLTNSSQEGYLYSHYGVTRQLSESSYSSDASRTTVKSNHRHSVTFEDDFNPANVDDKFKSPSDTSNNTSPYHHETPVAPPRRHKVNVNGAPPGQPERPKTLDLASSKQGILKHSSSYSSQESSRESPRTMWVTPSESGDHTPYFSTRSRMSPGNTPPHIRHQKTLLDIDMDGQNLDTTEPLIQPKSQQRRPTVQELEREFFERL